MFDDNHAPPHPADDAEPARVSAESLLAGLNTPQREAVQTLDGPVLIVAGAGSGKTRALTFRIAYMLATGAARPDQILALTFTNKAAREMRERIDTLVGKQATIRLWMGTFHAIFARLLRSEAQHLGYTNSFSIFDTEDSQRLIRELLNEANIQTKQQTPQQIQGIISIQKNALINPAAFQNKATSQVEILASRIYEQYQKKLKSQNAMDFDDLLMNTVLLFQNHPDVLRKYQERFRYIVVDEYQDTNRAQYQALRYLAAAHKNICVVGDDAQSIYKWRGADIRNMLEFERDFPECRVVRLEQNYRSTKNILASAHQVIAKNRRQLDKKLWTDNPDGDRVAIVRCGDEVEEGHLIVQLIKDEIRKKKLSFKDVAVLYRTNAQSRSVEDALRRGQLPYQLVGGTAFYQRREVKDVLAYLRVVANPHDDESLLRIINIPVRGIGETTIGHLRAFAAQHAISVYAALQRIPEITELAARSAESMRTFRSMLTRYFSLKGSLSANELARMVVDEAGFLRVLKEEGTPEALERRENILELLSAISLFCENAPDVRIEDFLSEAVLATSADTTKQNTNAVSLMTLHGAKGLEFPLVLIAGCEEGLLPLGYALAPDDLEEERRLFYVGMTRAKQRLVLLSAASRIHFGERNDMRPSRFLADFAESANAEHLDTTAFGSAPARQAYNTSAPRAAATGGAYRSAPSGAPKRSSAPYGGLAIGMVVTHDAFGPGRILSLGGRGDEAHALVEFRSAGKKNLMLKYANLRKM